MPLSFVFAYDGRAPDAITAAKAADLQKNEMCFMI